MLGLNFFEQNARYGVAGGDTFWQNNAIFLAKDFNLLLSSFVFFRTNKEKESE